MLKVLIEEQEQYLDLNAWQDKLRKIKYFGQVTLVFQDGHVILVREERTLKPYQIEKDF